MYVTTWYGTITKIDRSNPNLITGYFRRDNENGERTFSQYPTSDIEVLGPTSNEWGEICP